jgi:hypothetical protein
MADLSVKFVHSIDPRLLPATLEGSMTAQDAISELIANDFIYEHDHGYFLCIKNGRRTDPPESLGTAGVANDALIRITPAPFCC